MNEVKIDVEFLLNTPGTCVRCVTVDEAKQFLGYMKEYYPEWCENWEVDKPRFNGLKDGVGYTFYWKRDDEWQKDPLMFGSIRSIQEDGYTILDLWELMETKELEESDQSVDILFGGIHAITD